MFDPQDRSLIINHIIHLTPAQRQTLVFDRQPVSTIGVSVPVWVDQNKSVPAREVFCQYTITNEPKNLMVEMTPGGYKINLLQPKPEDEGVPEYKKLGDKEGAGWMMFKQLQIIERESGPKTKVLHQIEIRDWDYFWDSVNWKGSIEETCPSACSPNPPTEPSQDSSTSPN